MRSGGPKKPQGTRKLKDNNFDYSSSPTQYKAIKNISMNNLINLNSAHPAGSLNRKRQKIKREIEKIQNL